MNHFFVPPSVISGTSIHFPPEISHQIARVLRLQPGDTVIALDNTGDELDVTLQEVTPAAVSGRVNGRRPAPGEPRTRLTLCLGLTQREKFEWMLQKCTEVGASDFLPVITARSLAQDPQEARRKLGRWQKIVQEAAEQSGRGLIPRVHDPLKFSAALRLAWPQDARLLAWEEEHSLSLPAALAAFSGLPAARVLIFIGPEGGITPDEARQAREVGFVPVSLGARILRMETAAIAAAVLALHTLND